MRAECVHLCWSVCTLFACMWRGWQKVVDNEEDSIRIYGKSKVNKKKFFQSASWCRPTPSHYPIPFFQTEEEGCRQNKQTGLWSPRWWIPIPLLALSLSVYFCLARSFSLQPYHVLHRYAPNHSLAKQWHTQHLSFLFSPSSSLSVCCSCHRLCQPVLPSHVTSLPSISFVQWLWVE